MARFHRVTALLLALLLTAGLLPARVLAEEPETISFQSTYVNPLYADVLTEADLLPGKASGIQPYSNPQYLTDIDEAGAVLRDQMKNREETAVVYVWAQEATEESVDALCIDIKDAAVKHTGVPTEGDYLAWQYGGYEAAISGRSANGGYNLTITFTLTYYTTAQQEAEMDTAVEKLLRDLDLDLKSDYEKTKAIYDYICANVTYDKKNLEDNSYKLKYTAYAALIQKTAVCQGYAVLLYRLLLESDIDCRFIGGTGNGGPHGWNIVELASLYYNADSTWDAGKKEYDYFLKNEANFGKHARYEEYTTDAFHSTYPMSSKDYTPTVCSGDHVWNQGTVTKEPTESETGVRTYTCRNCGEHKTEEIEKLSHTHSYTAEVTPPTCTQQGYTTHTCACGDSYVDDYVDATGHTEVIDEAVDATCTEPGRKEGSHCSTCGEVFTAQEEISPKGHTWDEGTVTKEPTETETGIRTFTCQVCGANKTEDIDKLSHTHSYTSEVTPPTCAQQGYTTHTCACGDSYIDNYVDATGHTEVTDEAVDATCTEPGLTEGSHCSVCQEILIAQEDISPKGHTWDEGTITKEPTETETGIRTFTCRVCGANKTEDIDKLSHTHSYTSEVTPPTCAQQGYTTYTCACGDTYVDDYVDATGHTEVTDEAVDATCTEPGRTEGSHCSTCGEVFTAQEEISPKGHTWDEGTVTKEPTETETGIRTFTCQVCGEQKTEVMDTIPRANEVKRISGKTRIETALEVAKALKEALKVEKFDTILIANGENDRFADALTGSYLANVKHAPILMYVGNADEALTAETMAFIQENLSADGTIYLLGGDAALPEKVAESLADYTVERLSGKSRFDTNLRILEEAGIQDQQEILIARGYDFADSLSASATGLPILVVNDMNGKLTEEQIAFLEAHKGNPMTILGGTDGISAELEAEIEAVVGDKIGRVYGKNREDTSVEIAIRYFEKPDFALVAYSRGSADGLCGGPLAYAVGAPLLLTNAGAETVTSAYIESRDITSGYILGGTSAVSDDTAKAVFGLTGTDAVVSKK